MKINITIDVSDEGQEYTLGPYGEREKQHESEVNIKIQNKKEEDLETKLSKEVTKNM